MIRLTTASKKISAALNAPTFYKVIQGGQSAGKTYTIMTFLIGYCCHHANKVVTVVGKSYPFLDRGAMRDFRNIMRDDFDIWRSEQWNVAKSRYTFRNGTVIEFMPADKAGDAKGLRRDILYVNEANEAVSYEVFDLLAPRSRVMAIVDYNPTNKFWAHEQLVEGKHKERTTFLILTYKDNEAIDKQERLNIESHRPKPGEEPSNWWLVYGCGQIGSLEGNIYQGWEEVDEKEITANGKLIRYGLDFGFKNDETALVAIYDMGEGALGLVEKYYKTSLLGSQYPAMLERVGVDPSVLIVADSARPEIIAEIKQVGYRCIPCDKGAGSVIKGIDYVSQHQISYSGANLKREYLSYKWRVRKGGEQLDEPEDANNHAMDALRYAIADLHKPRFDF